MSRRDNIRRLKLERYGEKESIMHVKRAPQKLSKIYHNYYYYVCRKSLQPPIRCKVFSSECRPLLLLNAFVSFANKHKKVNYYLKMNGGYKTTTNIFSYNKMKKIINYLREIV